MTCIQNPAAPIAPFRRGETAILEYRPSGLRSALRILIYAVVSSFLAAMIVQADEKGPDWLPQSLPLPSDTEVQTDRAIGSSLRLFSFTTARDPDALLAEWEQELRQSGYTIDRALDDVLDKIIEFSGRGLDNAKIVIAPIEQNDRTLIELDASLP